MITHRKLPLCRRCENNDSDKRIVVKLSGWMTEKKIYLCKGCYYKICRELRLKEDS